MTMAVSNSIPSTTVFPSEHELPDDYMIYGNYLYVADGKLYRSDWHGITVGRLKRLEKFQSVKNCDIRGRREDAKLK